jgi:hypothetical protein
MLTSGVMLLCDKVCPHTAAHTEALLEHLMKIDAGFQSLSRICLSNLRGCDVGVTDGRDL